jgi:hypothetical protein
MTIIASPQARSRRRSNGRFLRNAESVLLALVLLLVLLSAMVAAIVAAHIDTSSAQYVELFRGLLGG